MVGLKELDQFDYGVQYQRGQPSTTQVSGIAGLASPASLNIAGATQNTLADMRSLGEMPTVKPPPPPSPSAQATKPVLAISRSTGKIWANGKLFTTDDAQGAIESEQFVGGAPVPAPAAEATDWEPLSEEAYAQHLGKIKNPSLTTLASKGFGTGVDTSQMLAGYGLQFLGATETGQGIVRQQLEDIRKNAPYQRSLEDVPERGVLEWFVSNLGQQGPNLIESAVTAAIGAGVGAAAGGGPNPFTAVGGAVTAMVGKQAFKQAVLAAAKKYAAGEVLDAAESKLLREAAGITVAARKELFDKIGTVTVDKAGRAAVYTADDAAKALLGPAAARAAAAGAAQAQVGGAAIATGLQNYATGVADLFGESVEGGQPDRLMAALGAVPYAAAETIPEYIAALRLFKGIGLKVAKAGARGGRAGTIATNVGIGAGAGAVLEGTTEAFQETLGIGMNADVDLDSPEGVSRLLNAFAAGAAIGGFVGAGSSLNTGKATDLLSGGTKPAEQGGTTLTGEILPPEGPAPRGVPAPDGSVPRLAAPTMGALPPPAAGPTVTDVAFAQPQVTGAPAALGLPPATTVYAGAPAPTPALTGPAPQPAAAPVPEVIPMGGPEQYGSALSQVATGGLPQAAPQGPFANRLQQQQAAAAEQARQAQLQATSGSALARIGRGEAVGMAPPAAAPQQLELPLAAPELQVTTEIPADPREVRVMYERMVQEQTKREELLGNKTKLAAYAKKRGLKSAEMRQLLTANYADAQPVVAELERRMASPEFTAQEAANKQAASKIKFKEVAPDATQVGQVEQGNKLQREQDRKRVEGRRDNRNVPAQVQEEGRPAGGGNRLKQGKAAQAAKPVAPSKRSKLTREEPTPPKTEGAAAAPSKKAEAGTAVAVVEPKKPVEDVEAKRKVAKAQAEQAEIAELASRALSDQAEVEAMIVAYNEAEPGSVESDDALIALIEYSKDGSIGRGARTRAQDYLAYEVDENDIKLAERKLSGEVDNDALDFNLITVTMEQVNNGELRLSQSIVGKLVSAWKRIKDKGMKYGIHPLADYIKGGPQFFNIKNGKVAPKGEGKFSISQWDNPDNPVPAGRIKLIIQRFTSKLAVRPKVYVFRNQADLKTSDPQLYTKMRAGRAAADFDTAVAAGYSLSDTVIIFSDRIGSEDHLSFVLAHETLGHFGFRGLMGNADFNALMGKLYDSDTRLRAVADITMSIRNLPKSEAVEEYLADYAAQLNTRLVLRFWNGVKSTLNRVGIKFGDEATRYLLSQSRRYVRTGQKSGVFETSSVMSRLWAVEHGQMGRFNTIDMGNDSIAASGAIRSGAPYIPRNLKDAAGKLLNLNMSWDKFKETFFSQEPQ